MPFANRIRLPFYLSKPQFPDTRNVFKRADGSIQVLSINISKVYEVETDYLPEWVHQCLKIAISHDHINIEDNNMMIGAASEGEYEIDWSEFLNYPYAQSKFKLAVTPFNFSNSNCQTCTSISQVVLVDDSFPDVIEESTDYEISVLDNDTVMCEPYTCSLVYTNAQYVLSASIDPVTGVISFTTRPLFFQHNSIKLFTYRVTCANGSYDEADVIANLTGSQETTCLEPLNLTATGVQDDSATFTWDDPTPAPAEYDWQLAKAATPLIIIDSGTITGNTVSVPDTGGPLDPSTEYVFSLRSNCGGSDTSDWVSVHFFTESSENACGSYKITYFGGGTFTQHKDVSYIACNGSIATIRLQAFKPRAICALENSPENPVSIIGASSIEYMQPC